MRSISNESMLQCPNGCEEFEAEYWTFIDAGKNPELKEALIGGELNLFQCPQCNAFFHHDESLIYFDGAAELMVFVFPQKDKSREAELVAKMEKDYELLKNNVLKQLNLDYKPVWTFGLEGLKGVLAKEEELNFESEVVAGASAMAGLQIVRLKPSYAREKGFPLYVAAATDMTAPAFAAAANKVLSTGIQSDLLKNFIEKMSEEEGEPPLILYDNTTQIQRDAVHDRRVCR